MYRNQDYQNRVTWQSRNTHQARLRAPISIGFPFGLGNSSKSYTKGHKGTLKGTQLSGSEEATVPANFHSPAAIMLMVTPTVQVRDTIELDETEEKIFKRLLGTLDHFGLETELRVAGGWVRDKVRMGEFLVGGKILICEETKIWL
jgi:hypothetical protein